MTIEEIARFFNDTRAFIQGNPDLRDPQVEGWFRTRQHFRNSTEHAILQIPVGCGKTGLMALLPFETAQGLDPSFRPGEPGAAPLPILFISCYAEFLHFLEEDQAA
jgi:hypothetical protein